MPPRPAVHARAWQALAALAAAVLLALLASLALTPAERDPAPGAGPPPSPSSAAPAPRGATPPPGAGPTAAVGPEGAEEVAAATEGPAAGRVRLSGRLVAARLEWGWVQAVPVTVSSLEDYGDDVVDEDDAAPDTTLDAEGVPTVYPWRTQRGDGASLGRPGGGWAVPRLATRVDRDGAFALDLAPGAWLLLAGARGCATRAESLELAVDRQVTWALDYSAPATLALTCLAASGQALAHGRLECAVTRQGLAPRLVTVGEGPWGPLDVEEFAGPADEVVDRALLRLDEAGRALLELPPGRLLLGTIAGAPCDLIVGRADPRRSGSALYWGGLTIPGVDVTLAPGERRDLTLRQREPAGATLVARVRSASGAPAPGVLVGLSDGADGPVYELLDQLDAAITGPDGVATFLEVAPGAHYLLARGGGASGRSPPVVVRSARERLEVELALDEVDAFGALLVRAVDAETGAPTAGVHLARTGEDADLGDLRRVGPGLVRAEVPLGRRRVQVLAPGRAATEVEVVVTGGEPVPVDVSLAPAAVVAGRLEGSTGEETVWLERAAAPDQSVAMSSVDRQGEFRFDAGPAAGDALVLLITGQARFDHRVPVTAPARVVVTLPTRRTVIQVLRPDGAPAAGGLVTVQDASGVHATQGSTDADGRLVVLGDPPPGVGRVVVSGAPTVPLAPEVVVHLRPSAPPTTTTPTAPRAELSGIVLDLAGEPVPRAAVWVHDGRTQERCTTDLDGRFGLLVAIGLVDLVVHRPDLGRTGQRVEVGPGGASVTLRFLPAVAVRLRAPPAAGSLTFAPSGDGWTFERLGGSCSFRRADGTFDLGRLLPGRWEVVLHDADYEELSTHRIDVALPGPLVVTLE